MARYTGPKNKLARKIGEDLGLKTNALKVAKRLMILLGIVLAISIIPLVGKVIDIHLPSGEEIAMVHNSEYTTSIDEETERPRSEENELTEEDIKFHEERSMDPIYKIGE